MEVTGSDAMAEKVGQGEKVIVAIELYVRAVMMLLDQQSMVFSAANSWKTRLARRATYVICQALSSLAAAELRSSSSCILCCWTTMT